MICPNYADRFLQSVGKIVGAKLTGRKCLSVNLGRPTCHVTEKIDGQRHVRDAGDCKRFTIIKGLDLGEFFQMYFDKIREFPGQFAV